jgi:hypothetical protein
MAKLDDRTYVSASGTMRMRVLPGCFLQANAGKPTLKEWEAGQFCFDHPALGKRYVMLIRIMPTGGRDAPEEDFRKAVSVRYDAHRDRIAALAYAVVGPALRAATARAVITGISILTRHIHAEKVFGEELAAAQWLHEQLPTGPSPQTIVTALEELVALPTP